MPYLAGVFDGHGGHLAADYLSQHLYQKVSDCIDEDTYGTECSVTGERTAGRKKFQLRFACFQALDDLHNNDLLSLQVQRWDWPVLLSCHALFHSGRCMCCASDPTSCDPS